MQININVSLQSPAKPRWYEQRTQQIQGSAMPRWQEQHANKHKRVTTSTCKALIARAACTTKFKYLQGPDGKSSMHINTNLSLQAPAKSRWQEQHANKHKLVTTSTCKAPMARAACTANSSICKAPMATAACTTKFKHLQSPDDRSSMQINTDISPQAFAKPRWHEQHANKQTCHHKHLQSPDGKSSVHSKFKHQQSPMARAACK